MDFVISAVGARLDARLVRAYFTFTIVQDKIHRRELLGTDMKDGYGPDNE
jgi:hypothetical protein